MIKKELAEAVIAYKYADTPITTIANDFFIFEVVYSPYLESVIIEKLEDEYWKDSSDIVSKQEKNRYHSRFPGTHYQILEDKYKVLLKKDPKPEWWEKLIQSSQDQIKVNIFLNEENKNNPHLNKIVQILSKLTVEPV